MKNEHGRAHMTVAPVHLVGVGSWLQVPANARWRVFVFKIATQRRWPWILVWRTRTPQQSFKVIEVRSSTNMVIRK